MSNLSNFIGGSSSGPAAIPLLYTASGTFTAPFACFVDLTILGAGGSGAANTNATGGNSGPWGVKRITLSQGDILTMNIGAGGAGVSGGVNGNAGGTTSVQLNGAAAFLSATGGEGGTGNGGGATIDPATIVSTVTGADAWFTGLQSGAVTAAVSSSRTGGAAVNVAGDGRGRSPSTSAGSTSTAGGSVGTDPVANATIAQDPLPTVNFLSFGIYPVTGTGKASNGNSGSAANAGGLFAGGGASGNTTSGGAGGLGAGGGSNGAAPVSGAGGPGAVFLRVTKRN